MTVKKERKVYTPEFKAKIGLEALKNVEKVNEIGQEYGMHPAQVRQWKTAIQEQAKSLFEGRRGPKCYAAHPQTGFVARSLTRKLRTMAR